MESVIEITPLTRVEGHGRIKLFRDGKTVERVELSLTESPRLFEALLIGKSYAEVPEIVCRICSLCSTVHKVTALLAVENAFGIEVSEVTTLTRELMMQGGMLQDHALHLYCLVLPDLVGVRGVAELAAAAPELLKAGLSIKRVGNLIQETVGGRLIHPVNITLGGLGRRTSKESLLRLKAEVEQILPLCREAASVFSPMWQFPDLPMPNHLALDPALPAVAANRCVMSDGRSFHVTEYREHVVETVLAQSRAKHARVLGLEPTVGSLARLALSAGAAGEERPFGSVGGNVTESDIRGNNIAQAMELEEAAKQSLRLIERLLEVGREGPANVTVVPRKGRGSAGCEAPRGVLIHSYDFDEDGFCRGGDVITPTTLNQGAIARDLNALALGMAGADDSALTTAMERLVRCYDPCISCSVHLLKL